MHCGSCASIITSKVSKLDGVQSCEVNFATKNAQIEFDDTVVDITAIAQEVKKYGYQLTVPH
jgi:Cu+-exporting ATPase